MKKQYSILLILLIVLGVGVFVNKSRPSEESVVTPSDVVAEAEISPIVTETILADGWKTFKNEEFGYEISYPPEAIVKHSEFRGRNYLRIDIPTGYLSHTIQILVDDKPEQTNDLKKYAEEIFFTSHLRGYYVFEDSLTGTEEIEFLGIKGLRIDFLPGEKGQSRSLIYVLHKGRIYSISRTFDSDGIVETMQASFRFID